MILTGTLGDNSDLFRSVSEMYIPDGVSVADVTFGKGVFWKQVDTSRFNLITSDLSTGIDFTKLPYKKDSIDILVLDPPYMHGGATVKKSINDCYRNQNTSHESVVRLYAGGILEASRVLKKGGYIFVKCQDEIESAKQRLTHCEILSMFELFGFSCQDIFVLIQKSIPAMREKYQNTARKNHSFLIIGKFRR